MSAVNGSSTPFEQETTFSSYNEEQGKAYAQIRRNYDPSLYKAILDYHTSNGGQMDALLDVGCGPGIATVTLALQFSHATGIDPSDGMLENARSMQGVTSTSEPIRFARSSAEELGSKLSPPISDSTIDLITAATAAHWFDMTGFWPSAARVLKPGGTVALWCSGGVSADPSMPNAQAIQDAIENHLEQHLTPYRTRGNEIARSGYRELTMPWDLEHPVVEFDRNDFLRKEWEAGEPFYQGATEVDLDTYEKMISTASAVTRWRKDHADLVGTEQDVVRMLRREIERLLHEAGVEKGKERVKGTVSGALLLFKKRA